MKREASVDASQVVDGDWVAFPGGELEGRRPKALCPACRERLKRQAASGQAPAAKRATCFQCYRAELDRERALKAAGQLDTASEERFQFALPFEPVNRPRLQQLKAARAGVRASALATPVGRSTNRRREAQINARHALQCLAEGLRSAGARTAADRDARERELAFAVRAAELQLPDAWLPFVVSR